MNLTPEICTLSRQGTNGEGLHMEASLKTGGKIHYAWVVMVAFGLVMCGSIGSLTVLAGLFFYPVST